MQKTIFWMCLVGLFLQWDNVGAFHGDVYQPRVPIELIEELQDIDNPYPATPERIELGKQIFYGKGLCVTCHSKNGKGVKQPGHRPRDFTDQKWQEIRTDGEMMWVLRNGSPGTQMPVRIGKVINEEEGWSVIHFIRTLMDKE
jgi:mono/diheme cytochrome c family protein